MISEKYSVKIIYVFLRRRVGKEKINMRRTHIAVDIEVPVTTIYSYVKNSVVNPKFLAAYNELHRWKREYSGQIVKESENRQLVIHEKAIDSVTGIRFSGWTITYDFESVGETKTKVGVTLEYSAFMAFVGMSTMKLQSINAVKAAVQSLLALEHTLK
jgi:hypothetical protein